MDTSRLIIGIAIIITNVLGLLFTKKRGFNTIIYIFLCIVGISIAGQALL